MRGVGVTVLLLGAACGASVDPLPPAKGDMGVDAGAGDGGVDAGAADAGPRDAGSPECEPVGEDGAFPSLGLLQCNAMVPGSERDFDLYLERCCYFVEPVEACETWRIEPVTPGVSVGEDGRVTVADGVPPGTEFRVVATLGDGTEREAGAVVDVYDPAAHPFTGGWWSEVSYRCGDGAVVENPIGEVWFCGPRYSVTFFPFEVYKDYWGQYTYAPGSGRIRFEVAGGNQVPADDADLSGVVLQPSDDVLVLEGLSFGSRTSTVPLCGHRLHR